MVRLQLILCLISGMLILFSVIGVNARPIKEEKEMIEQFANVFTMIDSATFNEVFRPQIKFLVGRFASLTIFVLTLT